MWAQNIAQRSLRPGRRARMFPAPALAGPAASSSLTSRPSAPSSARIVSATSRSSPVGLRISQSLTNVSCNLSTAGQARRSVRYGRVLDLDLRGLGWLLTRVEGSSADELTEEWLGTVRTGIELGVELRGDEERVVGQLDHLDQALIG